MFLDGNRFGIIIQLKQATICNWDVSDIQVWFLDVSFLRKWMGWWGKWGAKRWIFFQCHFFNEIARVHFIPFPNLIKHMRLEGFHTKYQQTKHQEDINELFFFCVVSSPTGLAPAGH